MHPERESTQLAVQLHTGSHSVGIIVALGTPAHACLYIILPFSIPFSARLPPAMLQVPDCDEGAEQRPAWEAVWQWALAAPALQSLTFDVCDTRPVPGGLMAGEHEHAYAGHYLLPACCAVAGQLSSCCRTVSMPCCARCVLPCTPLPDSRFALQTACGCTAGALRLQRRRPSLAVECSADIDRGRLPYHLCFDHEGSQQTSASQ